MSTNKSRFHRGIDSFFNEEITDMNETRLLNLFTNLALNRFRWTNLPKGIESRYIEQGLFRHGQVAFYDDATVGLICLPCSVTNNYNVYGEPTQLQITGINYSQLVQIDECVRILNNDTTLPTFIHVRHYASKIAEIDRALDINLRHQKTPYIIGTTKQNELTMKNLVKKIDNDEFAIYVDERLTNGGKVAIQVDGLNAPFLMDKFQEHKNNLICEFLTLIGINNNDSNNMKKERLIVDEVNANNEEIELYLDIDYKNRLLACDEINKKYGLNVKVEKVIKNIMPKEIMGEGDNGKLE